MYGKITTISLNRRHRVKVVVLVSPGVAGLEPATSKLTAWRYYQLSYTPLYGAAIQRLLMGSISTAGHVNP